MRKLLQLIASGENKWTRPTGSASLLVSLRPMEHIVSPHIFKSPSITSVDSILLFFLFSFFFFGIEIYCSRTAVHIPQDKPDTSPAVHGTPDAAQPRTMNIASQMIEPLASGTRTWTSTGTYPGADATDGHFVRHPKYFFKDGNVAFLVRVVWLCKCCEAEFIN